MNPITSLEQLRSLICATYTIPALLDGQIITFTVRRLSPKEKALILEPQRKLLPPPLPARPGETPSYNFNDPGYQEKLGRCLREARAMRIYLACEIVAQGRPGLAAPSDVCEYVESLMNDALLELLDAGIMAEGLGKVDDDVLAKAHFTSGSGRAS